MQPFWLLFERLPAPPICILPKATLSLTRLYLMQELRGIGLGGYEVPEWKTKALGKAPTFGMRDARPIKEQRESLPIFKLRDQLVQAVAENQARCALLCSWASAAMTAATDPLEVHGEIHLWIHFRMPIEALQEVGLLQILQAAQVASAALLPVLHFKCRYLTSCMASPFLRAAEAGGGAGAGGDRRDGQRQDHADDAVPG